MHKAANNGITKTLFVRLSFAMLVYISVACNKPPEQPAAISKPVPQTTITALIWAPDWPEEMQRIADQFSQENPTIKVDVQFMIGDSVEENLKPKIAADHLPDIISINPNAYAARLADQGILIDLGETASWNNMLDSLKPDWTSSKRRYYGISGGVAATLMYYNREMFAKAGISKPPGNFEEFLEVCERLKKAGFTPIMWNGGFPNMLGNGPFSFGFANNVVAKNPDWKNKIAHGMLDLNTPEVAEIFERIKLVADRGYVQSGYMNTNYDDGIKLFTQGKTAMAFHGTWAAGLLMHGKGFTTGIFIPPWNDADKTVVPVIGNETGFGICDTPNKQAALKFLDFMNGKGYAIQQNKRQNISPFKKTEGKIVSDPQILDYIAKVSQYPLTANPYYSSLPAETIEILHPLLLGVLFGKKTPQEAAYALDASVKDEAKKNN